MVASFSERLRSVIDGSRNAFAKRCGLPESSIRQYLDGTVPRAEKAILLADAAGVELRWLITGEGPKYRADAKETVAPAAAPALPLDEELFAHVFDRVARTYKAEGVRLPEGELARIALRKYPEIEAFGLPRDEWQPLLELLAIRLRKEIAAAAAEPGSGKASA